jgi:hypothetical protein
VGRDVGIRGFLREVAEDKVEKIMATAVRSVQK